MSVHDSRQTRWLLQLSFLNSSLCPINTPEWPFVCTCVRAWSLPFCVVLGKIDLRTCFQSHFIRHSGLLGCQLLIMVCAWVVCVNLCVHLCIWKFWYIRCVDNCGVVLNHLLTQYICRFIFSFLHLHHFPISVLSIFLCLSFTLLFPLYCHLTVFLSTAGLNLINLYCGCIRLVLWHSWAFLSFSQTDSHTYTNTADWIQTYTVIN